MAERKLRAVIHIGAEKTGTTTLQEFLHLNREALAAGGVLFPTTPGLRQHVLLTLACMDPGRENRQTRSHEPFAADPDHWRNDFTVRLQEEIRSAPAGARQLLLTTELLHTQLLAPREVARLKALLDPFCDDYRIVFYMRRQDRLEVSRYSTNLRAGGTRPSVLPKRADRYLDYERVLARWEPVFGAGSLVPRVFDATQFHGGDLLSDFVHAAGLPLDVAHCVRPGSRNTALSARAQWLLRQFNLGSDALPWDDLPDRARLTNLVADELGRRCPGPPRMPARSEAVAFQAQFADANARLARRWFGRDTLFDDDFSEYPEVVDNPAPAPALAASLAFEALAHAIAIASRAPGGEHA